MCNLPKAALQELRLCSQKAKGGDVESHLPIEKDSWITSLTETESKQLPSLASSWFLSSDLHLSQQIQAFGCSKSARAADKPSQALHTIIQQHRCNSYVFIDTENFQTMHAEGSAIEVACPCQLQHIKPSHVLG